MAEIAEDTHLVPAVARAAAILDLVGQAGQALGSNEIARQLGLPKSSTANICLELLEAGMLVRRDNGYALGRKLVELGGHYLSSVDALREYYDMCASLPILSRESSRIAISWKTTLRSVSNSSFETTALVITSLNTSTASGKSSSTTFA